MAENGYGLAGLGMGKVKSINQYRLTPGFGGLTPVPHVTTVCRLPCRLHGIQCIVLICKRKIPLWIYSVLFILVIFSSRQIESNVTCILVWSAEMFICVSSYMQATTYPGQRVGIAGSWYFVTVSPLPELLRWLMYIKYHLFAFLIFDHKYPAITISHISKK